MRYVFIRLSICTCSDGFYVRDDQSYRQGIAETPTKQQNAHKLHLAMPLESQSKSTYTYMRAL
jgi:hypothetical protein